MRIGEVAAKAGVSTRALRYYEEQQLLSAERSASGQRHYPDGAVDRVRLIQLLYTAGLGSKAVLTLLPCMATGVPTPEMLERLVAEQDRIDRRVAELTATRDRLADLIVAGREAAAQAGARPVA